MSVVESTAESGLVGLGRDAEASPRWEARKQVWSRKLMLTVLVVVQLFWLGVFLYAAFRFI